jgi:putative endonuclease
VQLQSIFAGRLTQTTLKVLDWLAAKALPPDDSPEHLQTGRSGEEEAYFYLRRRGYIMIARNYRSPNHRGEIDLVGWDGDVLCFVEVKTRTTRAVKPAQAAVDRDKQKELGLVARDFLRHLPVQRQRGPQPARFSRDGVESRFDVLAVYYDRGLHQPSFELFQNAFSVAYNPSSYKHGFARSY